MRMWWLFLFTLLSCSQELQLSLKTQQIGSLGGRILPLDGIVFHPKSRGIFPEAYAVTCDDTVYARLYAINTNGKVNHQPLLSTEVQNGRYSFPASSLPQNINSKTNYVVVIEGCDQYLSRPVTSFDQGQDVTFGSSLIAAGAFSNLIRPLNHVEGSEVKKLINLLNGTSVLNTYSQLSGSPTYTSQFNSTFADVPSKLLDSYPVIILESFPTMANEGLATTFKVKALHFNNSYSIAYEWHYAGVEQSTSDSFALVPHANASGSYDVTLFVGSNDGSNHVDRTKPFFVQTKPVQVINTILATPPEIALASPYTNTPNVMLRVSTGSDLENCHSFSNFLLTESMTRPSATDLGFVRTCSSEPEQSESFSLSGADGTKIIYVWVRDAAGNVSATPESTTVVLDRALPILSLSGLVAKYAGGSSASFNYSASDALSGLSSVELFLSTGGGAFVKVKDLSRTGTLDSLTWPSLNVTDAYLKIVATDNAGNIQEATSGAITIDSIPPSAPNVTLASAAYTNSLTATLNIVCTGITDVLIGESVGASDSSGWASCASSMTTTLVGATQGLRNIRVFARDDVRNVSNVSTVSLTYDHTAPTVLFTSTPAALSSESTFSFQFSGSDNLTAVGNLTYECSLNNGAFAPCSSPSTQTGFITGSNQFSVRAQDLASNLSSVSTYTWSYDNSQPTVSFTDVTSLSPAKSNSLALRSLTISGSNTVSYKYTVIRSGSCSDVDYSGLSEITLSGNTTLSFTPTTDGTYQVCVIGKSSFNVWQLASNASASPVLTIDTTAPTLLNLVLLPSEFNTNLTPSVTGTTKVSSTVTLHLDSPTCTSSALTTVTADSSTGSFTVLATTLSSDANYNYYVKAMDEAGNSVCSSALPYTLDRVAPSVVLNSLSGGQVVKGAQVTNIDWSATDLNLTTSPITIEFSLNGGVSWTQVATNLSNSGSYAWNLPGYNTSLARMRVTAVDKAGNSKTETSSNFTIDSSSPILSLDNLTGGQVLKGGTTQEIRWTASDTNSSGNWISLSYSSNGGSSWTSIASTTNTGSYNWTVPTVNSSTYRVRVVATDSVGQATTVTSTSNLIIDSTAPTITLTSFTGGQAVLGNSYQTITWNAVDTNFSATPISIELSNDSGNTWSSIASNLPNTGSYSWQVNVADASTYRIRVKAVDLAGFVTSSASSSDFTVSTQAPKISQTTLVSPYFSNSATSVTFGGACDDGYPINVTGAQSTTLTCHSGAWSWTTATQSTDGVRDYTFTQTNSVLTLSVTSRWVRDTVAPALGSVLINDGAGSTGRSLVTVTVTTAESGIKAKLKNAPGLNADCQALYADNSWQNQTSLSTNFSHILSSEDGDKKVCVWLKDNAGNVSVISPNIGSAGVDVGVINLSSGNIPRVTAFSVTNDGGGDFQGTTNAHVNDPLKISWTVTDVEGLANNPIYLDYTQNGTTWTPIEAGYGNLSGNPSIYTDDYVGFSAPVNTFFRIRIRAFDKVGNTSAEIYSQSFNTTPWSVYAGNRGRGDGGSGKTAKIYGQMTTQKSFAIHPLNNDIYFLDSDSGLKKISASTGLITKLTDIGASTMSGSGTVSLSKRVFGLDQIFFDNKGFLYLSTSGSSSNSSSTQVKATRRVIRINTDNLTYTTYLNGGAGMDNTATPTNVNVLYGSFFAFDSVNSLYFLANCTPTVWTDGTSTVRLMKVTQKEDGSAGTVSVVAGNCTRGVPVSGQLATATPFTNSNTPYYMSLAHVSDNQFYVFTGGSTAFKIINGTIYSTAVATPSYSQLAYSAAENLLYVSSVGINAYSVNTSGANGEVLDSSKALTGTVMGTDCEQDGTAGTSGCFSASYTFISSSGKLFFTDGTSGRLIRLRYLDDANNLQTLAGSLSFSGHGKDVSLANGMFTGIYYKKSSELLDTVYPPGLYFLEKEGGVFGYIDEASKVTKNLWGNQSGIPSTKSTGADIGRGLSLGRYNNAGDIQSLTFDNSGRPWLRVDNANLLTLDENKKILSRNGSTYLWTSAPDNGNPLSHKLGVYGGVQNFSLWNNKLFLYGATNSPTLGYADENTKIKIFDYDNNKVVDVMGDVAPGVTPQQTTPGSLKGKSLSSLCQNTNCSLEYVSSQNRLYFTEGTTLRYITDPMTPANHTLIDVFQADTTIGNFTISPDRKYVFYTKAGSLYCHAFNLIDESAICKNDVANHINLGPPPGLQVITRGANQFTWKNNSTLYISNYDGEIYEYLCFH